MMTEGGKKSFKEKVSFSHEIQKLTECEKWGRATDRGSNGDVHNMLLQNEGMGGLDQDITSREGDERKARRGTNRGLIDNRKTQHLGRVCLR